MPQPLPTPYPMSCVEIGPPMLPAAQGLLPLQGLTLLLVEDSRFSSDAMRLICQRAGARLRRAECLQSARAHLRVYRPDVVIVDLGLPDGRGEDLIRQVLLSARRPSLILGTSGSASGRATALAAGADGYLDKPIGSFSDFCTLVRQHFKLTDQSIPGLADTPILPDPLALQDDLAQAAAALHNHPDATQRRYLGGFLLGLARLAQDAPLADASLTLFGSNEDSSVTNLIETRLAQGPQAFVRLND
jgi:DNA-binding NarL/FixJ family response regulator